MGKKITTFNKTGIKKLPNNMTLVSKLEDYGVKL